MAIWARIALGVTVVVASWAMIAIAVYGLIQLFGK